VRRGSLLQLLLLSLAAFGVGAAVAVLVPWMPTPASREAGRIWFTYWFATWICLAIFAIVAAVLIYALLKFRVKEGDLSDGPPVHGHTTLEIVWTAVPFVLVTAISIVSAIVLAKDSHAGSNPLVVKVVGQQFAWQFTYPNGKTFGDLRLPLNRHVKLQITANDVIHSFWVPQMGQKQDAVPGQVNPLVITPDRVGTFPVICTELCGLGHSLMRSRAIVMPVAAFDRWYRGAGAAPAQPAASGGGGGGGGANTQAAALFKTTGTCGACHAFTPAGTSGQVGPSLDHLKEAAAKAGQPLEGYVKQSIEDPDAYVTPGYAKGVMSGSCCKQLSSDQVDQLVQYLVENTK
jgi:cytochrome c oxidase subunit II